MVRCISCGRTGVRDEYTLGNGENVFRCHNCGRTWQVTAYDKMHEVHPMVIRTKVDLYMARKYNPSLFMLVKLNEMFGDDIEVRIQSGPIHEEIVVRYKEQLIGYFDTAWIDNSNIPYVITNIINTIEENYIIGNTEEYWDGEDETF